MKKIGALVYRELLISKKFYITSFLIVFCFSVFGYLVLMSMEFGNIAKMFEEVGEESAAVSKNSAYYIFNYFAAFIWCMLFSENGTSAADIKTKWRLYGFTLPVTEKENALVKLIFNVSGIILSFLGAISNGLIISAISGIRFDLEQNVKIYFLIILFWMFSNFFSSVVLSWARTQKEAGLSVILQIFILPLTAAVCYFLMKGSKEFSPYLSIISGEKIEFNALKELGEKILERFGGFALPCILLLIVISYFVNLRMMKRRYK